MSSSDIEEVNKYFKELKNQLCWNAGSSFGSMLIFDFGRKFTYENPRKQISYSGEWSLLIEQAEWQIFKQDELILSWETETSSTILNTNISELFSGQKFQGMNLGLSNPILTKFIFTDLKLNVKQYKDSNDSAELDVWSLYTPYGKCFTLTSKNRIIIRKIDQKVST